MTLEYLISLGVAEEIAKKVLEEWDKLVSEQGDTAELQAEVEQLKTGIEERDTQLKELQEYEGGLEGLKSKLEELELDNTTLKTERFNNVVEDYLKGVGVKSTGVVLKLLDLEKVELGEDGVLKGIEEQVATLKEESPYLFEDENEEGKDKEKVKITTGRHKKKDDDSDILNFLTGRV